MYSTYEITNTVCKYVAQTVYVIQDAHTPVNQDYSEAAKRVSSCIINSGPGVAIDSNSNTNTLIHTHTHTHHQAVCAM